MSGGVIEDLTEAECRLYAILRDTSGLDLAEFSWHDPDNTEDGCWRAWPFQWEFFRDESPLQISQCARAVGKTLSITLRMFVFPFLFPGQEAVVTAPELVHLEPLTGLIERRVESCRLSREMIPRGRSAINHRPFQLNFVNGSRIIGRIPQRDGRGVNGIHPIWLEMDEASLYPRDGWTELIETLKRGHEGAVWRAHGVTRGHRDKFYEFTQEGPNNPWKVHRICLPGGTLVYGVDGPFSIEDARVGTMVWSIEKDGTLVQDRVTAVIENGPRETWRVEAKGGLELETTRNHPYLVLARGGTRRTRRALGFEWVEAHQVRHGDYIVGVDHLDATGTEIPTFESISSMLVDHSPVRSVPSWVWRSTRSTQMAFLAGYLMGDGCRAHQKLGQDPWQVSTASERMARELRALCHYLGLRPTALRAKDNTKSIVGGVGVIWTFYAYPDPAWFWQIPQGYSSVHDGERLEGLDKRLVARRVVVSVPTGEVAQTYDITVGDHHNYIAEGVVVHNTAMSRPNWTAKEREEKIQEYGSRDHPDYRRNILGLHGDSTAPIFVLHRLMQCIDSDLSSSYNTDEYAHFRVNHEQLTDRGGTREVVEFLDFPEAHRQYKNTWIGMDVGMAAHPSEIMVFAEVPIKDKLTKLKLITRVHLERISNPQQVRAICWVMDFYRPNVFALDKTGLGLPLFQDLQESAPAIAAAIRGYNFSEKILVDFDEGAIAEMKEGEDDVKVAGISKNVLEYATDFLRDLVDHQRLQLPWDLQLIGEFQGSTWTWAKQSMDIYGRPRRVYAGGNSHALDGCRMAVLGYKQHVIEEMMRMRNQDNTAPVYDYFVEM